MLKIYLQTTKYYICNEDTTEYMFIESHHIIRNENNITSGTTVIGAYTDEAKRAYPCLFYDAHLKRKGKEVVYEALGGGCVYLKQWKAPNAKLVLYTTYEEDHCSMKELMNLPSPDVIAYLKQEGLDLTAPS